MMCDMPMCDTQFDAKFVVYNFMHSEIIMCDAQ